MSREDIEKMLGGYATGTLTPEEREALFAAALEDQTLFEALIQEEPLRELLQEPAVRTRLKARLEVSKVAWYRAWLRPAVLTAAVVAIAGVALVVERRGTEPPKPVLIAQVPPIQPPVPVRSPLPQVLELKKAPAVREAAPLRETLARAPQPAQKENSYDELKAPANAGLIAGVGGVAAEPTAAPAPPPPPPATPGPLPALAPRAAEPIRLQAAQQQVGAAGGLMVPLQDPRALFSAIRVVPNVRTDFLKSETQNRTTRAVTSVSDIGPAPAAHLGLRYTVLHRQPAGGFEAAAPGAALDADDQIALRLEANDAGYLTVYQRGVNDSWSLLANERLARLSAVTVPRTGGLAFGDGPRFFVLYSRQPQPADTPVFAARDDQQVTPVGAEEATYVVSTEDNPAAQRLAFPITIRRQ